MNLLFDLDGTLTDPKEGIVKSINYAMEKFGLPVCEPTAIERFIGPPLRDTFRVLLDTDDAQTLKQAVAWYRERYVEIGYLENYVYEGIREMLAGCVECGCRLFVATSKRQDIAKSVIAHFGLAPFFSDVYGCDVDLSKADLIAQIAQEQGLASSNCLMIGDRRHDVEAARPNAISTIGVLWGYGTCDELTTAGAVSLAHTPTELLSVIRGADG